MKRRAQPWRGVIHEYLGSLEEAVPVLAELNHRTLIGRVDESGDFEGGAWSLRSRVGGVIDQMWPVQTATGPVLRGAGAFIARAVFGAEPPRTMFSELLFVPEVLADRLHEAWSAERASLPERHTARIVFDYCLWGFFSPLQGVRLHANGSHWSADPLLPLLRSIAEGPSSFPAPIHLIGVSVK